jgi:hypothetical protein
MNLVSQNKMPKNFPALLSKMMEVQTMNDTPATTLTITCEIALSDFIAYVLSMHGPPAEGDAQVADYERFIQITSNFASAQDNTINRKVRGVHAPVAGA